MGKHNLGTKYVGREGAVSVALRIVPLQSWVNVSEGQHCVYKEHFRAESIK